ncbi:MAG: ABC transporter ATP-binding protein [Kiritimatiellia bacterium]|nr:ABC transporter ATP-binding protein [Kiritimatiellia bacterium]
MNPEAGSCAAIELESVFAGYGAEPILRDLSLRWPQGERGALIGPNGSGKSTLLRVMTGWLPVSAGRVRLFGRDLRTIPPAERATLVSVVPQDFQVPMPFTVAEVVLMGRTSTLSRWARPARTEWRAAEEAMAHMDILDLRHRRFHELSGGERQRAAIALALAREPKLLLLDEPTSHLDMHHGQEIIELVERLNLRRGITVLMTGHDLGLAADFSRRLILLNGGRVEADGTPESVLREDRLERVYRSAIRVGRDPDGGGWIIRPRRPALSGSIGIPRRVHVIAGGGSGTEILRSLVRRGHQVTCGVLNEGDTDAQVARALGVPTALEPPFSPIRSAALAEARELAKSADLFVLCEVPFGTGNVANLELAEEAIRCGRVLYLPQAPVDARDFTPDGEAGRRLSRLESTGSRTWRTPEDLVLRIERPDVEIQAP